MTLDQLMTHVEPRDGGCWLWHGALAKGYGQVKSDGHNTGAHRLAYELLIGPIPSGHHIDHLCRQPRCVNPTHMEPVTQRENTLRGRSFSAVNARKTHCAHGHPYQDNARIRGDGARRCLTCYPGTSVLGSRTLGWNTSKTHCSRGHEFTPDNTYRRGAGRECRTCRQAPGYHRPATRREQDAPRPALTGSPVGVVTGADRG